MLIADRSWHEQPIGALNTAPRVHAVLAPLLAIATLLIACLAFGEPLGIAHLVLVLLVFPLAMPALPGQGHTPLEIAADILTNWLAVVTLLLATGWITDTLRLFDGRAILAWVFATPLLLATAQLWVPFMLSKWVAAKGAQRVAVIAGGGELARRLMRHVSQSPYLGIRVAGCFDDRAPQRLHDTAAKDIIGGLADLAPYAKQHHVDVIYLNMPMTAQPRIIKVLEELRDTTASIYFVPDIFLFDLIQARMATIGGIPILAVCETPFYGVNGVVKRISDLVIAAVILILISPLMLAIAIGVKLSSPGPVLFRQRRYGLDGREIIVFKFRTMTVCEDGPDVRQATKNDSRVTRLGAFLRANSLDELPQFINVLQGRMSVVGPRPHAVAHNEMYRKLINGYMIRHKVRPGITGWAQVNGERGETATLERMQKRVDYDLAYLRNWSLRLDLQIILKTVLVVLRKENAY